MVKAVMEIRCTRCGGKRVIKVGKAPRDGKWVQNYFCKDCMKRFLEPIGEDDGGKSES